MVRLSEPASRDLAAACRSVARLLRSGLSVEGVWVVAIDEATPELLAFDASRGSHDGVDWASVRLIDPGDDPETARGPRAEGRLRVAVLGGHGEHVAEIRVLARPGAPLSEDAPALIAAQANLLGSLFGANQRMAAAGRRADVAEAEATRDHLTGVGNRRAWEQALLAEEARCRRYGHDAAVLLLDLDGLKRINDTRGHQAGDDLLRAAAVAAESTVRPFDVVARLGGDEFALLLSRCGPVEAEELRNRLTEALRAAGVAASVGLGVRPPDGSLHAATAEADRNMYHRKPKQDEQGEQGEQPPVEPPPTPPLAVLPTHGTPHHVIDELLERARHFLGLDLLFVGEWKDDFRYFRHLAADEPLRSSLLGTATPLGETFCLPIVEGRAPGAIADAREVPSVAGLALVQEEGVRAHLGVPLELPSGEFYGTLCGANFVADPRINQRDLGFMHFLATVIAEQLGILVTSSNARRAILERLDALMTGGGPRIVFQPIVDLSTGEIVGFEALSRFISSMPRSPALWFEEAAEVGLDLDLELAALRAALRESARLPPGRWTAVNVSPDTLRAPALQRLVAEDAPAGLVLELTGHAHLDEVGFGAALRMLRSLGTRIGIDDAGAGYSGLARVLDVRPDIIKLDVALVRGIAIDPARRALARSLIAFADEIGATVVAEGMEHEHERATLVELGVPLGQGYLLGAPAAAEKWAESDGVPAVGEDGP